MEHLLNFVIDSGVSVQLAVGVVTVLYVMATMGKFVIGRIFDNDSRSISRFFPQPSGSVELKHYDELRVRGESSLSDKFMDEAKRKLIKKLAKFEAGFYISYAVFSLIMIVALVVGLFFSIWFSKMEIDALLKLIFLSLALIFELMMFVPLTFLLFGVSSIPGLVAKIKAYIVRKRSKSGIKTISFLTAKRIAKNSSSYGLIDARSLEEYRKRTLRGAICVSDEVIEVWPHFLEGTVLFVFSDYGIRSLELVLRLKDMGIDAYDLGGVAEAFVPAERIAIEMFYLTDEGLLPSQIRS